MPSRGAGETDLAAFLSLLEQRAPRPLSITDMVRMLECDHYNHRQLRGALDAAVEARTLRRIGKTRYQWVRESERRPARAAPLVKARRPAAREEAPRRGRGAAARVEGRYARVRAGFGFVEVLGRAADRFARDILIPAGMEGTALHGDRVEVEIVRRDARLRRVVGRITAVTGPVHERILGTLQPLRTGWCLVPEQELLPTVVITGDVQPRRDQEGLIALVRVTRRAAAGGTPTGELEEVLGTADDPQVQFLSIAYEHGLRIEFPAEVVAEAERLPADPSEVDCTGRRDLRALPFVTIDGETARDFDDAVCLEPLDGGGHRLWVAIADVSHYVRPGSELDAEAARRGTSVYFPDRAIPMLPAQLSNTLCSLNPARDRLVLVAEMVLDAAGQRHQAQFCRAVMRSRARLTYTQVAAVLSQADTPEIRAWRDELGPLLPQLERMQALMRVLFHNRVRAGSLDLDLPEALVDLSEEGRSVGVRLLQRNDAHRLIEEFMLEANRAVAAYLAEQDVPFPYRIHEPPDPDDIDELNAFLGAFGARCDYDTHVAPRDVQRLLGQLEGHRLSRVLSRQVLRALTKAQYSTANAGHFGLAFRVYCHFTSPIRRYPDLLVHRQLGRVFDGDAERARAEGERMELASVASSQAEREAMEAERAMLDLKKAEFMLAHLMEPSAGTIVSVTNFGFFVELDAYPVEGLVRAEDLPGDRYTFIEEERALKGLRTGQRFRLGDRVEVEATNVSLRRRQIDFALLNRLVTGNDEPRPRRKKHDKKPAKKARPSRARPPQRGRTRK